MKTRTSLIILALLSAGFSFYGFFGTRREAQRPTDPSSFFAASQDLKINHVIFQADGWAYYVEPKSPNRLYIAAIIVNGNIDLESRFQENNEDLRIISCGRNFGEQECDLYSVIDKAPHNGNQITVPEVTNYWRILIRASYAFR